MTTPERASLLAVLGLPAEATPEEATRAYRRLAREVHPDATADVDAAQRFAAISDAYHQLARNAAPEADEPPVARPVPVQHRSRQGSSGLRRQAFAPRPPIVAGPVSVAPPSERGSDHR
jgi:hypothetical protein